MESKQSPTAQNKKAWEYRAYEFWHQRDGTPAEKAARITPNPREHLRYHGSYFADIQGKTIANPCGSNGRKAVPLALLGAEVTVFDISEENRRYALALAEAAGVPLRYEVGDFCAADRVRYGGYFDIAYLEGGILHYFHDLALFFATLYDLLKPGGALILSDFHPLRKVLADRGEATDRDYFQSEALPGAVAYKQFFPTEEQDAFPDCLLRYYTMGEIVTGAARAGFLIRELTEHPQWTNAKLPGEFTLYAHKA